MGDQDMTITRTLINSFFLYQNEEIFQKGLLIIQPSSQLSLLLVSSISFPQIPHLQSGGKALCSLLNNIRKIITNCHVSHVVLILDNKIN